MILVSKNVSSTVMLAEFTHTQHGYQVDDSFKTVLEKEKKKYESNGSQITERLQSLQTEPKIQSNH